MGNLKVRIVGALIIALVIAGCAAQHMMTTTAHKASKIQTDLHQTSKSVTDSAKTIQAEASAGKAATPVQDQPCLNPHWDAISTNASTILVATDKLDAIGNDVGKLKSQLVKEELDHKTEVDTLNKKLDAANGRIGQVTTRLITFAIVGMGIAVVLGLLLHDTSYAVAGIAGCGVVIGASLLVGQVMQMMPVISYSLLGVCVVWAGWEWWRKRSVTAVVADAGKIISDVKQGVQNV